jgi:hypothetical protein
MVDTEAIADFAHEDALTLAVLYEAEKALTRSEVAERIGLPEYKRQQAIYRLNKLSDRGFVIEHRPEGNHEAITFELNNFKGESYGEAAAQYTDFENPMDFDKRELLGRVQELSLELVETRRQLEERLEDLEEEIKANRVDITGYESKVQTELDRIDVHFEAVGKLAETIVEDRFIDIGIVVCDACESWFYDKEAAKAERTLDIALMGGGAPNPREVAADYCPPCRELGVHKAADIPDL